MRKDIVYIFEAGDYDSWASSLRASSCEERGEYGYEEGFGPSGEVMTPRSKTANEAQRIANRRRGRVEDSNTEFWS